MYGEKRIGTEGINYYATVIGHLRYSAADICSLGGCSHLLRETLEEFARFSDRNVWGSEHQSYKVTDRGEVLERGRQNQYSRLSHAREGICSHRRAFLSESESEEVWKGLHTDPELSTSVLTHAGEHTRTPYTAGVSSPGDYTYPLLRSSSVYCSTPSLQLFLPFSFSPLSLGSLGRKRVASKVIIAAEVPFRRSTDID